MFQLKATALLAEMRLPKATAGICRCQKVWGIAFEMHPVSAPSLSVYRKEAGNDSSIIPVPH